jgi:zinc and cadmium transporter
MSNFALSLVLGLIAALADVLGALILVRTNWEKRYLRYFVALGAGFMLAAALLEMVPESFHLSFRWTRRCLSWGATASSTYWNTP